jgi:hypothetical protein
LWARRLNFDLGDFAAVDAQRPPRILWSVATLRSSPDRERWVAAQRAAHPYLRVLNATDKGAPLDAMVAHFDALGLKAGWDLPSYGQVAWFLTYLRWMAQLLASGAEYGVLLNDDVLIGDDFRDRVAERVAGLELPEHAARRYASYRLGRNDAGLLVPRASAARILGLVCEETVISQQTDQWQVEKNSPRHGTCRLTYNGTPFEGLVDRGELNTHSTIQLRSPDYSDEDALTFKRAVAPKQGREAPGRSFCAAAYPGRVAAPGQLRVQYAADFTWDGLGAAATKIPSIDGPALFGASAPPPPEPRRPRPRPPPPAPGVAVRRPPPDPAEVSRRARKPIFHPPGPKGATGGA